MKEYITFRMQELKKVALALNKIKSSFGANFEKETQHFLQTISSKKSNTGLSLKLENLEKVSMELHGLEVKYGINLGQTIYHFMHAFHKN